MNLRIVSYNIFQGGEGRADPIAEVCLAQRADVIALHEATDQSVLERLSHRLNMDYAVAHSHESAVAVFSRHAILQSINSGRLERDQDGPAIVVQIQLNRHRLDVAATMGTRTIDAQIVCLCNSGDVSNWSAMGFEDALRGAGHSHPNVSPDSRPDTILIKNARLITHWIEYDRLASYASDHYPVGIEIEVAP